jgi:uncharacterized RDD family membrane protein YckC
MSEGSTPASRERTEHRGAGLGFPASGPGSVAGLGRRFGALVIDCLLAALVASVFTRPDPPKLWGAVVLFLAYTFFTGVFGQTVGMRLLGIGCVRVTDGQPIGIPRAALRALLLQLLFPAAVLDQDGRGWHDRLAGSVMVRG